MSSQTPPTSGFRDSAAVVLVRGTGADLETFWVRRSDAVAYLPGFHAFIGGSVDADDAELDVEGAADENDAILRACAIREAFEEAGVLVALDGALTTSLPELAEARRQLLAGEAGFPELAWRHGWRFRADGLESAGRWQTPPFSVTRFDTLFYLARVPGHQEPHIRPGELAEGEWVRPAAALERYRLGQVTFAAPMLHTLLALAEGDENLAARLALGPEIAARPVRRIELKWGIVLHAMKTRPLPPHSLTNAYLVGEHEMALVDPGGDDAAELEALFRLIDTLAEDGRRLRLVLLTHQHPDHVGGVEAVRARYRVPVAAHAEAARAVRADVVLQDGDTVPLEAGPGGDWNLRVLHTPGHARGHVCFLHLRTRSLLCGDQIPGGRGTVIIDPPEGDMRQYLDSLERLLHEPVEWLFPAHGAPQGGARQRISALIAHRLTREAKVLDALPAHARPLDELLEQVYDDTVRELWPHARRSLLAHLEKLEAEGRAAREGEDWRRA